MRRTASPAWRRRQPGTLLRRTGVVRTARSRLTSGFVSRGASVECAISRPLANDPVLSSQRYLAGSRRSQTAADDGRFRNKWPCAPSLHPDHALTRNEGMSPQSTLHIAIGLAMLSSVASAQRPGPPPPTSSPHFEVASIKRNLSSSTDDRMNVAPGGRLVATNIPIRTLIRNVYRVQVLTARRWAGVAGDRTLGHSCRRCQCREHGREAGAGLRLDSRNGPVEFLVIDSAERPVED